VPASRKKQEKSLTIAALPDRTALLDPQARRGRWFFAGFALPNRGRCEAAAGSCR
jgi:hypothetical protein